ncbi:1861_t:CDS:1 [Ambispora leptoticha]|uniref:1861_t:CDS:1 n=1 Tax=Ambispora leptoticha TaxID=144679 RepID=A0A9N9BCN3_9GLOM|nr:1861_t:CDS:1 [Ambispora leptoticha]
MEPLRQCSISEITESNKDSSSFQLNKKRSESEPEEQQSHLTKRKRQLPPNFLTPFVDLKLPKGDVTYYPQIGLIRSEKITYYKQLISLPYWKQPNLVVHGRQTRAPRLTCSFGSQPNKVYRYSGTTVTRDSVDYPPPILHIKSIIEKILDTEFNFVLLNWYKNGDNYIGEHSDDERGLKKMGVIACVSLGAERNFVLRNKTERGLVKKLVLADGSMVVMKGNTQANWKHSVPREKKVANGRISLTFRQLV